MLADADILLLVFRSMDLPLFLSMLEEDQLYAGMSFEQFSQFLEESFGRYKTQGDNKLLPTSGFFGKSKQPCYVFLGNLTKTVFPLVFSLDDNKQIEGFHIPELIELGDKKFMGL